MRSYWPVTETLVLVLRIGSDGSNVLDRGRQERTEWNIVRQG